MKKWFLIRHIRWIICQIKLARHVDECRRLGLGYFAQDSDIKYLEDVWKGKK